jgi:hydrogenase nickel incorporation protein HypB
MNTTIAVKEKIFDVNDRIAAENREIINNAGIYAINIMASPGAGKTSLIEYMVGELSSRRQILVIDGDLATSLDADRASAAGAQAYQINTGGQCHLDAVMLRDAFKYVNFDKIEFLIVENVGNLVCPIDFQLGTHHNIMVASIPEGDDKPYKYPGSYQGIDALVVNKIDLLPYISFKMDYFLNGVRALNPDVPIFHISCKTGEGMDEWIKWIDKQIEIHKQN